MNNIRSAVLLGIGITAAALTWFKVPDDSPAPDRVSVMAKVSNNKNFAVQNSQPPQTESKPSNKPDSYPSQRLNKLFTQATDYRVFVSEALQHPEEGGLFYAKHALGFCGPLFNGIKRDIDTAKTKAIVRNGTLSPVGINATDKVLARCANLSSDEASKLESEALSDPERLRKDPLLQAQQWSKIGKLLADYDLNKRMYKDKVAPLQITDTLIQNMQQMLDTQDSTLFTSYYGFLDYLDAVKGSTTDDSMWFNGEKIPHVGGDQNGWGRKYPLRYAVMLSMCKIGSSCQLRNEQMYQCAMQNCLSSEEEVVRFLTNQADGTNLVIDRAIALEPQVTAAIRNRDVKAFLPRK